MRAALLLTSLSLAACYSGGIVDSLDGAEESDGYTMPPNPGGLPSQGGDSSYGGSPTGSYPTSSSGQGGETGGQGGANGGNGGQGGVDGGIADAPPSLASADLICKLISDQQNLDPTPNATHTRANVLGTDLGIPVAHGSDLFFLFGDTVGFKGIWPFSESGPDSVGYAAHGRAGVAADPSRLCDELRFLRVAESASLGPSLDPAIERDFAAVSMAPPAGHSLSEYIKNPAGPIGQNAFPMIPGSFEVPSGAFSYDGDLYAFYTTVQSPQAVAMKASYLARWSNPTTTGVPHYQILHSLDERFSASGPLLGRFINVASEIHGDYLYMFGTGDFRDSPVYLARKQLAQLELATGYEVYDAESGQWLAAPATQAKPVIADAKFGETSLRYFSEIDAWMLLAQADHQIVARFAEQPEGPWSEEIVLHDNTDLGFLAQYCCFPEGTCGGERLFNCSKASFYGTFLLPDVIVDSGGFTVSYTMSTWDPYNVALFSARFSMP